MRRRRDNLSLAEARRIALAAQGFGERRLATGNDKRALRRLVERLGVLQIDSVNVLTRAHTLPAFSRLGPYALKDLQGLAYDGRRRALFEYWGHEASLLPVTLQPMLRWRMARARRGEGIYKALAVFGHERQRLIGEVRREIADRGPLRASELSHQHKGEGGWWGWSDGKRALEWLFWTGELSTHTRHQTFERAYDLTERVLPPAITQTPTPNEADAQRHLLGVAAAALGIASERSLRDYFRLPVADTRLRIAELLEAGELIAVAVEGGCAAYLYRHARQPRQLAAQALLAPFDPLIWQRQRAEVLFGARIRLELYTPREKRIHGYYVLPFLLNDRIVARLDLKADRANSILRVEGAHLEPAADRLASVEPLSAELRLMSGWLGLERIKVRPVGDLAAALTGALRG
jgi:uncharacterized protein